jgi:hypothetical protein
VDHTKIESTVVEQAIAEAREDQINELSDLQLALIGGGYGETILR